MDWLLHLQRRMTPRITRDNDWRQPFWEPLRCEEHYDGLHDFDSTVLQSSALPFRRAIPWFTGIENIVCHPNRCRLPISLDTDVGRASNGPCISNRRGTGTVRRSACYICPVYYHESPGSSTQRDFPPSLWRKFKACRVLVRRNQYSMQSHLRYHRCCSRDIS